MASRLRDQMITGGVRPGDRLPSESELMTRYGASRPPVREALRILESEDLLMVKRGMHGGAIAVRPTPDSMATRLATVAAIWESDVTELDSVVEALELAMLHRLTADGIHELRAGDPDFHSAVVRAAGGDLSIALHAGLTEAIGSVCTNASLHARSLRALRNGHREDAFAAWRGHRGLAATEPQSRGA